MILPESYSVEWIRHIQKKTKTDPGLIEKVIQALTLLEQLQLHNLDFVFKGGRKRVLRPFSTGIRLFPCAAGPTRKVELQRVYLPGS